MPHMGVSSRYPDLTDCVVISSDCLHQLARHAGIFDEGPGPDLDMAPATDLEKQWKQWARREAMKR
jgi:hypothetical protein